MVREKTNKSAMIRDRCPIIPILSSLVIPSHSRSRLDPLRAKQHFAIVSPQPTTVSLTYVKPAVRTGTRTIIALHSESNRIDSNPKTVPRPLAVYPR